jgi:hypothetical protein
VTVWQRNHGKVFISSDARRCKKQSWFAARGEYSTVAAILDPPHTIPLHAIADDA